MSRRLTAESPSWVSGRPPAQGARLTAKTRYRQQDEACTVVRANDAALEIEFDRPQWAVTPGQSVVVYSGPLCLGGATISHSCIPEQQATPESATLNKHE
jgi:tRNA-specific 2-thiouridylase